MIKLNNVASFWLNFTYYKIVTHDYLFSHPTPRITLFVRSFVTFFTPSNANAHQSYMWVCALDFLKKDNNNLNANNNKEEEEVNNDNDEEEEEVDDEEEEE